ncbi:MAG TPA: hypothetical protein PK179_00815 [Spirochaetales bacterium]|nr:hypothetical protein [Spirochaetales bacterium]
MRGIASRTSAWSLFAALCVVLAAALGLSSCGIDTIAYLALVTTSRSNDDISSMVFLGPYSDEDEYFGLVIYYKIYANAAAADVDRNYIAARQADDDAVPGASVETYLASSSYLGYQRLVLNGESSLPTIHKDYLTDDYYITVELPSGGAREPYLTIVDVATASIVRSYVIRRAETGSDNAYLTFLDEPKPGAADYRSSTNDTDDYYYVQFYAAAYGIDLNDFSNLFGDAISIGRLRLSF